MLVRRSDMSEPSDGVDIRRRSGWYILMGLVIAAGGLSISASHTRHAIVAGSEPVTEILSAVLFAFPFFFIGMMLIFLRCGTVLFGHKRYVYSYWGVLVPFYRVGHQLGSDSSLVLQSESRMVSNAITTSGVYTVYTVRITSPRLGKSPEGALNWILDLVHSLLTGADHRGFLIDSSKEEGPMRERAAQVSRILQMPVQDCTAEPEVD